jgi:hypothetical protein
MDCNINPEYQAMNRKQLSRRQFVKTVALAAAASGLAGTIGLSRAASSGSGGNPFPRWRGFNLTDFNSPNPSGSRRGTTDDDLKWMVDWGFDFVRLPMAYPRYVEFDRSRSITPEEVCKFNSEEVDRIEAFVHKAQDHGLHVSINLHRAPGYCINAGFREPFNLWKDKEAQEAFSAHWGMWAKRFKDLPAKKISFDLLNEPALRSDMNDQHATNSLIPGELYRAVAKGAVDAIRAANPDHLVIADGNRVGNLVTPELVDLKIGQSCRGYFPGAISHYKAPWANKDPEKCPTPVWPGTINGELFDRARLETYYQPWMALAKSGVGCTAANAVAGTKRRTRFSWRGSAMCWISSPVTELGMPSGISEAISAFSTHAARTWHQDWHGHKLDAKLLDLLKSTSRSGAPPAL